MEQISNRSCIFYYANPHAWNLAGVSTVHLSHIWGTLLLKVEFNSLWISG
jgi:hypothetical protein